MFSDKTINLIFAVCFGSVAKYRKKKADIWDYEPGLDFFISFLTHDMSSGVILNYEKLLAPVPHFGIFDRSWSFNNYIE